MLIENALSDAVRFFRLDALSSAAGLKVDFDFIAALTLPIVIASGRLETLGPFHSGTACAFG